MLDIAVEDDRISPYKCRNRLTTWKDAINAFIKPAQSCLQAQKKQTKVPRHFKGYGNRNNPEIHLAITS